MPSPKKSPANSLSAAISCLSDYDPEALSITQAHAIIRRFISNGVTPAPISEKFSIRSALGRVLACDITSPINVPAYDNSAMDGYAFRGIDLQVQNDTVLQVVGTAHAGHAYPAKVEANQAIRIMTGALLPDGADTVIPQEFVQTVAGEHITIAAASVIAGANRRLTGEDLQAGAVALQQGRILRPADLGLLASLGISEVPVQRRLRVAFFSTGDELRAIGDTLDPGCVYDSNRYTLYGMLTRLGCEVIDMGVIKDDPALLKKAFREAADQADAIITSGGVSVGDADHTKHMMAQLGEVAFWKIAMRPGRPFAFGSINSSIQLAIPFFGLPGNPVAVMVSFYFFVRDALLQMMGAQASPLPLMRAPLANGIRKRPGRTEYQRGMLSPAEDGAWTVRPTSTQGSGILRSMTEANCIIVLSHDQADVATGDQVNVILFDGLI